MRVLSLFDGMACGAIAFTKLNRGGYDSYDAYEIDEYAIKVATHNFPDIKEHGDVFKADFTQYKDIDYLIGGSPCTYWSIAQKNNRETTASGLGWELFSQYVRALKEVKPKWFLYENNKSMSNDIRQSISNTFGFEPICINSALVSAQNRQRLYWCGKRNLDGTYSKVDIPQPKDLGILLKDILESGFDLTGNDKTYCLTANYNGAVAWNTIERSQRNMVAEPINICENGKSHTIKAQYYKNGIANFISNQGFDATAVAEPIRIPPYGVPDKARPIEALYANHAGTGEGSLEKRLFSDNPSKQQNDLIAEPIRVGGLPRPNGEPSTSQAMRVYSVNGKSVTLSAGGGGMGGKTGLYAIPIKSEGGNFKIIIDEKEYIVYDVKDGQITIKGKQYPIKLSDGYYIIRKLTVTECKRLQTVPEWYDMSVISNSQAYKCLGNGWTVDVIVYLLSHMK